MLTLPGNRAIADGARVELGIRPDAIAVVPVGAERAIPAEIVVVEHLGGTTLLYVQVGGLDDLLTVEQRGKGGFARGQTVSLLLDPVQSHLFDRGGKRI